MLVWQLYLEKVQCTNKNWTASISLKKESDHLQIFPTTKNQQKTKNTSFQDIHWGSTMAIIFMQPGDAFRQLFSLLLRRGLVYRRFQ